MTSCLISVCLFFNEIGLDTMAVIRNISADMNTFSLQIGASCQVFTIVNRFFQAAALTALTSASSEFVMTLVMQETSLRNGFFFFFCQSLVK